MEKQDTGEPEAGSSELAGKEDDADSSRLAHFIRLLSDDDEVSRWKAAEELGRIGDPAAVEDLIGTLWDDDERVRLKAAWALGRIADPRAYAPLQRLYHMENERVKEIITEALENIRLHTGGRRAGT
jgi:HEAT repeat protein